MRRLSGSLFLSILLFLSAMPDTMAAPVLKELFVDRYGVSARQAQVFMAFNLVGALLAIPALVWARRRMGAVAILVAASLLDAALLVVLAAPIGFVPSLVVRGIEGVTDVVVFAALFDLVRRQSGAHAARGLGYASTPLLLGLGGGAVVGGIAAAQRSGADPASSGDVAMAVFGVSALAGVLVAFGAFVARRVLTDVEAREPEASPEAASGESHAGAVPHGTLDDRPRPFAWSCAMAFVDRATGGLITGTLPIVLAGFLGYTSGQRGWLIGLPLLLMAVGTGPAGALCDRVGSLRVRLVAGVGYAGRSRASRSRRAARRCWPSRWWRLGSPRRRSSPARWRWPPRAADRPSRSVRSARRATWGSSPAPRSRSCWSPRWAAPANRPTATMRPSSCCSRACTRP